MRKFIFSSILFLAFTSADSKSQEDADDADWKNNPEAYIIEHKVVDASTILNIMLAAGGGCAISIKPQ